MTLCHSESQGFPSPAPLANDREVGSRTIGVRASAERQRRSSATVGSAGPGGITSWFGGVPAIGRACSGRYDSPTASARGDRPVRLVDHVGARSTFGGGEFMTGVSDPNLASRRRSARLDHEGMPNSSVEDLKIRVSPHCDTDMT